LCVFRNLNQTTAAAEHGASAPTSLHREVSGLDERLSCGTRQSGQQWLNATLSDSAGGRKVEIFEVTRRPAAATQVSVKRHHAPPASTSATIGIKLHPQAAVSVCRHVVDTLIILAKGCKALFWFETNCFNLICI